MSAIILGNPNTGQFSTGADVPYQLRAFSKDDPKQWARGLTAEEKIRPLTTEEAQDATRRIKRLGASRDPQDQAMAQALRRRLGVALDPPWDEKWLGIPELQVQP